MRIKIASAVAAGALACVALGSSLQAEGTGAQGTLVGAQGTMTRSLDLREAVLYAVEHAPALDSAKKLNLTSDLAVKNSVAAFLPSLDFSTTDGLQGSNPVPVPGTGPWTTQAQIALTENLYDNGTSLINRRLALINQQVAALTEAKTRDQLCLNVAQEFYQFSLLGELLKVKQQQHELYQEQYNRISNQYRQGLSTRQDYLRFKAEVQSSDLDLLDAQTQLRQAEAQLRRYIAGPGALEGADAELAFQPIAIATPSEAVPTQPAPLPHSYDFRIARAQEDANRLAIELAERKYWPGLNITAGVTQSAYSNSPGETGIGGNQLSWNALAALQFNLWDGGTRRRNVQIAELAADSQNDLLTDGLLETQRAIAALALDMSELSTTYKLTAELLKLSQDSFDLLDQQYRLGQATYLDLVTGLGDLLDAKVRFYTTHFNLLRDLAQFRYYDGTLYDSFGQKS